MSATSSVVISITNGSPSADAGGPYSVAEESTVVLSGAGSDPAGPSDPLTFEWDLDGDGVFAETGAAAARGEETLQNSPLPAWMD